MCWYYTTHIASLLIASSHTRTKYKMVTIFGLTYQVGTVTKYEIMQVGGITTWKTLTIGVQAF